MTAKRVRWSPEIIGGVYPGGIPWTAEENKRLFDMLQEECSLREISTKLNRSYVSVKDKVNRLSRSGENARQPSTQKRVIARDIKEKAGKASVKCLKCLSLFDSYDPRRNRICVRCKGNEDWK
jgi:hypothetical protein